MRPTLPVKQLLISLILALVLYIPAYAWIEHLRTRHGPWQVTFNSSGAAPPSLSISAPKLGIANARIVFPGESSPPTNFVLTFTQPEPWPFDVPFGNCLFEDLTFLPGTLAFNLFGHEIQLIPRALTIDKQNHPWQSGSTLLITNRAILPQPGPATPEM
jgi:hypothetical protein